MKIYVEHLSHEFAQIPFAFRFAANSIISMSVVFLTQQLRVDYESFVLILSIEANEIRWDRRIVSE